MSLICNLNRCTTAKIPYIFRNNNRILRMAIIKCMYPYRDNSFPNDNLFQLTARTKCVSSNLTHGIWNNETAFCGRWHFV